MRTNAVIRIIIWSLVLVLLVGMLVVGMYRPEKDLRDDSPTEVAIPETLPPTTSNDAPSITSTASEKATIYATPNPDDNSVGKLKAGETVTIGRRETVSGEPWFYITQPTTGWVMEKHFRITATAPAVSGISLDPRQIREIEIEWVAGHITVEAASVDSIEISESTPSNPKYAMVWEHNNSKLTIRFCENASVNFGFGINDVVSKDLTVLVPLGWQLHTLEVDAASATVDVKNLSIRNMDFDGASGTCNFDQCHIGELDLDTASGDIYFTGTLETLECDAASASVYAVFDNVPSHIDMDSMSGDLDITLPSDAGFTVSLDALSSDFFSDFEYSMRNDKYCCGDGKCMISMDAMSGDVYIREQKTQKF